LKVRSPIIGDASGKLGGAIWARNAGGLYVRAFVTVPDDPTTARGLMRTAMSETVGFWKGDLDQAQREPWEEFARNNPSPGRLAEPQQKGGMDEFIHANVLRRWLATNTSAAMTWTVTPPESRGCPNDGPAISLAVGTTDTMHFEWPGGELWNGDGGAAMVWISSDRVAQTRNFYARKYRFFTILGNDAVNPASPVNEPLPYDLIGGWRCFWRMRVLTTDGRMSPEARGFIQA
jgi:hypothetical protein